MAYPGSHILRGIIGCCQEQEGQSRVWPLGVAREYVECGGHSLS